MKGVILREAPGVTVVDLSHGVPAQDVVAARFYLERCHEWFSPGTVHLCVVDPGVGTARAAIAARANGSWFVAPDNGVLDGVLRSDETSEVRRIDLQALHLTPKSRTFHGRDVFAKVAAWLARERVLFEGLGPVHTPVMLDRQEPVLGPSEAKGEVILVDHFGNLITDIPAGSLTPAFTVEIGGRTLRSVGTYGDAEAGECCGLIGSYDTLEVARRDGSAAAELGVGRGAKVRVRRERELPG
jgi:S-adenosylmethionine hydrolase